MCGELAGEHRTGAPQQAHHMRIRRRHAVQAQAGMAGGGVPREIDDILQPDGNAVQRRMRAIRHDLGFRHTGCLPRLGHGHPDKGIQLRIPGGDARQQGIQIFHGRELPRGNGRCRFG
jgi:hypothetical protein